MWQEGNLDEAIRDCREGLEIAQRNDDVYGTFRLLRWLSILTVETDPKTSLDMLEEAYQTGLTVIGSPYHIAGTLTEMGAASETLGEYDLALRFHHEGFKIYQPPEGPVDVHSIHVSSIHAGLENGRDALTWAEWALEQHLNHGSEGDAWTYLAMTHALVLLYRLDEAQKNLDIAQKMVIKSGHEDEMACYYFTSGIYELETGDTLTAVDSLERAFEISERMNILLFMNKCLLALTNAEITLFKESYQGVNADISGPHMGKLETHALEKGLPGIVLQLAILKSEFFLIQKRRSEARQILFDALNHSASPGLRTLRKRIQTRIEELEDAIQEGAY
jgi:tetratricopeptide (TPR) repeat protein